MMMRHFKLVAALMLLLCVPNVKAQTENGFKEIDVLDEFADNPFNFFANAPILAAADSTGKGYNSAMTIGWGDVGRLWNRPVMTVYVAQKRYTHEFIERAKYFTVMVFDDTKVAEYMGSHSGRDGDKAQALGLHVAYTQHGAPYFVEAKAVLRMRDHVRPAGQRIGFPQRCATPVLQSLLRRHPFHVYR